MVGLITFGIVITVIGMVLITFGILIFFWIQSIRVRRKSPKFESVEDLKKINYDGNFIERRKILEDGKKTNGDGGSRSFEGQISGIRGQKETNGYGGYDELEIQQLKSEIARKERELGL